MRPAVAPVTSFFGRLLSGPLPVEADESAAIAACWEHAVAEKPKIFNGRILLAETTEIRDGALHVAFREAAFATLMWLRTSPPDELRLLNVFAAAAVVSSDGAALLGRMAPHTANAGQIYFPCGTPDRGDLFGDAVDLEGAIVRELAEETGLAAPLVAPTERRVMVAMGEIVACLPRFDSQLNARDLAAEARRHLARETNPELDAIFMARSIRDLDETSPLYVHAALPALLASGAEVLD